MRFLLYLFVLSGVLPSVSLVGQRPIARYTFDNTPNDFSGNNNHGIIYGAVTATMDRFGNHCGAYRFGGNGYIEVPNSPSLETPSGTITITTWYRLEQKRDNQWLTILCKGITNQERPNNPQYRLQVQQNVAPLVNTCAQGQASGSSTISINTAFTECDNQFASHALRPFEWGFYALVFDGNNVIAYMNDRKVFEFPYTLPLQKNSSPLYIGLDEPGVTEYFEGSLDDVRIYDVALNQQQLLQIYNEQRSVNWNQEEYTVTPLVNKQVQLPATACKVKVNFDAPRVTNDGCGKVNITQVEGQASGSLFSPGKHLIAYKIESTSGYTQSCGFYIEVKDLTPPVISVPADTTIYIDAGMQSTSWSYRLPMASDNCAVTAARLTKGLPPGGNFTPGRHLIEYTATDIYGTSVSKKFSVTVKVRPPAIADKPKPAEKSDPFIVKTDTSEKKKEIDPVVPPGKPKDTANMYKPADLDKRDKVQQQELEVNSSRLKIVMYDNAEYDGDTISLFLNGKLVISKTEVNTKGTEIYVEIDTLIDNELVMYAENLGSIPPNTALVVLYDGEKRYEINLSSSLSKNGLIRIRRKKKKIIHLKYEVVFPGHPVMCYYYLFILQRPII